MSVVARAKSWMDRSMSDDLPNIPTPLARLNEFTDGLTQGTYILLGGETGSGKTSFARDVYMYSVWDFYKKINDVNKLDILNVDLSLEIMAEINVAGLISRKLYLAYGKVLSAREVLSNTDPEIRKLIDSFDEEVDEFYDKCLVFEEDITPGRYHDILMEIAKQNGKFTKEARFIGQCGEWVPNNPKLYIQVFLDTINLGELDSGHINIKTTIDRLSRISVWFRNKCKFNFIVLQQFHGDLSTTERKKSGMITPKMTDFEDSKRPGKDCDIALGLYDPVIHMKEGDVFFRGYNIEKLKSWFRSVHLMKNRRGERNKVVPLKFDGAVGIFTQLPDALLMTEEEYQKAINH